MCLGQVGARTGERSFHGLLGHEAAQAAEWEGGDQPRSSGLGRGGAGSPGPGEWMLVYGAWGGLPVECQRWRMAAPLSGIFKGEKREPSQQGQAAKICPRKGHMSSELKETDGKRS